MRPTYLLGLLTLLILSCQKDQRVLKLNEPINQVKAQHAASQVALLINETKSITKKLADSKIDFGNGSGDFDQLLVAQGIVSKDEIINFKRQFAETQKATKDLFDTNKFASCNSCNYQDSEKFNKLMEIVSFARVNPQGYNNYMDNFGTIITNSITEEDSEEIGPNCSFAFYVCITLCSGASSGVLAAACVYLCACSYCELKPPGC